MILAESPRRQRVTKLVNWGHWFALANIFIALIIASIYVFSSPLPGTALGTIYLLANWFGHIGFLTFFAFVILILPMCYLVSNEKTVKTSASITAAISLALFAFDALLYNRTGFHISLSSADLLRNEAQNQISQFGWQQWSYLLLLFIIWLGFQLVLANAIWKRIDRLLQHKIGFRVTTFFTVCFVSSHAVHVWADAQLYQPIIKQDNMFPLSYPATAKTTMSRYGLLDLERYEQRKQLQFDPDFHAIKYPAEPIYCSIERGKNVVVLIQTDQVDLPDLKSFDLRQIDHFYSTASTLDGLMVTSLFGVPEIYQDSLQNETPVMLELPAALGTQVSVYSDHPITHPGLQSFVSDSLHGNTGITVAFVTGERIVQQLTEQFFASNHVLIATGFNPSNAGSQGVLYTNLDLSAELASSEDIAPTVLGSLGCLAPAEYYATGQNLLQPKRNWLVSTSGERIVVMYNNLRTEVLSNGSYEITNFTTGARSNDALNVDLLSRAIKHMSRFSTRN